MSARKTNRRRRLKPPPKVRGSASRPSSEDIEKARLALIGVAATCELVSSSYTATRSAGIVLTRGALQPLREALELLGEEHADEAILGSKREAQT